MDKNYHCIKSENNNFICNCQICQPKINNLENDNQSANLETNLLKFKTKRNEVDTHDKLFTEKEDKGKNDKEKDQNNLIIAQIIMWLKDLKKNIENEEDIDTLSNQFSEFLVLNPIEKTKEKLPLFQRLLAKLLKGNLILLKSQTLKKEEKDNIIESYKKLLYYLETYDKNVEKSSMFFDLLLGIIAYPSKKKDLIEKDIFFLTLEIQDKSDIKPIPKDLFEFIIDEMKKISNTMLFRALFNEANVMTKSKVKKRAIKLDQIEMNIKEIELNPYLDEHIQHIFEHLTSNKNIYSTKFVHNDDDAITTYDSSMFISSHIIDLAVESLQGKDKSFLAKCLLVCLHELFHIKRMIYYSKNDIFDRTPGEYTRDIGDYFEKKIGISLKEFKFAGITDIFMNLNNWVVEKGKSRIYNLMLNLDEDYYSCNRGANFKCATSRNSDFEVSCFNDEI